MDALSGIGAAPGEPTAAATDGRAMVGGAASDTYRYPNERTWRRIFQDGHPKLQAARRWASLMPSPPRCSACRAPFQGPGGFIMRRYGVEASGANRLYCNRCELALEAKPGAADVELSIVYADVRGSTRLAEDAERAGRLWEFVGGMDRFRAAVRSVIERTFGFVIDLDGDAIVAIYPPGLSGPRYARFALRAARQLVELAALRSGDGVVLPFGVGLETGRVCVGNKFRDGPDPPKADLAHVFVMGDRMNVAARLASAAAPGEALVSTTTIAAAAVAPPPAQRRLLRLDGRELPVEVLVLSGR